MSDELSCKVCGKNLPAHEVIEELCRECRKRLGLPTFPIPDLRPAGPCQRCGGGKIIKSWIRDRVARGTGSTTVSPLPVAFAMERKVDTGSEGPQVDADHPIGVMVAYICLRCGFTELYTAHARQIPIGPEHGTALFHHEDRGPYR